MSMRTHDDQIRVKLLKMLDNTERYVVLLFLMHMYFNWNSEGAQVYRDFLEVGLRLGDPGQVPLTMNDCWRMLFHDMQQGYLCVKAACHLLDDREH